MNSLDKKIIRYTIGIVFDEKIEKVILILKNRPKWQAGKYNFPGGHIENGESAIKCVVREFKEECNIKIDYSEWKYIGVIENTGFYTVDIYTSIYKPEKHGILKTMEDQPVIIINKNKIISSLSNVRWLTEFAANYWIQGNKDNLKFGSFLYKY